MAKRPLLITVISVLTLLVAILLLLLGAVIALAPESTVESIFESPSPSVMEALDVIGGLLIVAGLIMFLIGYALLKGWTVAWYLGVIIWGLVAVGSAYSLITGFSAEPGGELLPLVVSLVIIFYLFRPAVKDFFKV